MYRKPNAVNRLAFLLLLFLIAGVSAGCGSSVRDVRVMLLPTNRLNPDESGDPLSVMVRVYQLKNKDRFERADFRALWKNDEKALEGDIVERKEVTIYPNSETSVELQVDQKKGVHFLGIMALFRKPEGEVWRQTTSSDVSSWIPFRTPRVKVILDEHKLKLKD